MEQLQEIDLKIDGLTRNKEALPAILKALDDQLGKAKLAVQTKAAAHSAIDKMHSQAKAALDLNNDRLQRSTARMEAVRNTHEYQAATKEIEQIHKMSIQLGDQLKKFTTDMEATSKELADLEGQMQKIQAERDAKSGVVSQDSDKFDAQIATLMTERNHLAKDVDKGLLARYNRIRKARQGIGFIPAVGGRCKGCNMLLPPQLFNMVQKGKETHDCPSCHRILYIPVPKEIQPPPSNTSPS